VCLTVNCIWLYSPHTEMSHLKMISPTCTILKITVLWDVALCTTLEIYQHFRIVYCPHVLFKRWVIMYPWNVSKFYVSLTVHLHIIVKKNQLDAQLILSIVHQPLHFSGISRPIIRRYSHMYTTIGTDYYL